MATWNLFSGFRFNQRIEEMRPRLYRVAYSWTHNREQADDLVQETLLKALNKVKSLRNMEALDGWLFTIMNNCWRDFLRQQRPQENIDELMLTDDRTPEDLHQRHDVTLLVQDAIARLPQAQRQTIALVDIEGFSYAEVAEILEVPIGTVMSRLCRARSNLSSQLLHLNEYRAAEPVSAIRRVK